MLTHYGIPFLRWTIEKVEDFHEWLVAFEEVLTSD